ncbi:MAG: HD domain-containing protein [Christensenellales bacterium]|jgi:hypothetical protein|nr:HD domain-containing protein [Clostridiales bacterium]
MSKINDEKVDVIIDKKGLISADSLPAKPDNPRFAKEQYIAIFKAEIKRPGADAMLDYLENKSDFFDAPASTRFHLAEKGGLVMHSLNVYHRLKMLVANEKAIIKNNISQESIAICALLHDICKANYYTVSHRNVKQIDGSWTKEPYYTVDEKFPFGHGEKSVFMISQFIKLSGDEALAINWHMGAYDERLARSFTKLGQAFEKCPLAVLTHIADMQATYLDEIE